MKESSLLAARHDEVCRQIIEVALKAFMTRGIKAVTMDDIAHELTMSKRTLYQLFSDKEALLKACFTEMEQQHVVRMQKVMSEADNLLEVIMNDFAFKLQRLQNVSPQFVLDIARYPEILRFVEERRAATSQRARDFLQRCVQEGLLREDVNYEIVYDIFSSHVDMGRTEDLLKKHSLPDMFYNFVLVYLRGCATPRGAVLMDEFFKKQKAKNLA